ncbi:hypothetical protein AB0L49_48555 [Streptomyces antimycoticus]|uniref:hypothetical protein n=1 Tax=Streptomyces antimycoticus TaxID=68175 RepID=UPI00341860DD
MHIDTFHRIVRILDRTLPLPLHGRVVPVVGSWAMRRVPDRRYLERRILPWVVSGRPGRVLFVGTSRIPDTRSYHRAYDWGTTEFWTMDIDPGAARWGGDRHQCGDIRTARECFPAEWFDCIILNGVLGWGVNEKADQERALEQCRAISRAGAALVLGWNTSKCQDPRQLSMLAQHYEDCATAELPVRKRFAETDHIFDLLTARQ